MATVAERRGGVARFAESMRGLPVFFREVRAEMRKVTWPDKVQLRSATGAIIVFVLLVGVLIWIMDLILQAVLVRGIQGIFT